MPFNDILVGLERYLVRLNSGDTIDGGYMIKGLRAY